MRIVRLAKSVRQTAALMVAVETTTVQSTKAVTRGNARTLAAFAEPVGLTQTAHQNTTVLIASVHQASMGIRSLSAKKAKAAT